MEFEPTSIPDVILIRPRVFGDARGYFLESWHESRFASAGITAKFVQDNHSHSARHVLRGLHYQMPNPQGKLVRVTNGAVFDVAVDIRRHSPTFGRWVGTVLSGENHHMLWVPAGFAHGYLVLSDFADFVYRCTDFYVPASERAIAWNDPEIGVDWPLPRGTQPSVSGKDAAAQPFRDAAYFP